METTIDLISEARVFAIKTHQGQMYGNKPYIYHLDQCFSLFKSIVEENELDFVSKIYEKIAATIYLHDTMEDQGVHYAILEDRFGKDVAEAVWCVTKEKPYNPDQYFEKISKNPIAAIVKLCDRICNVNNCFDIQGNIIPEHKSKAEKYIKEHKYIINILNFDFIESPIERAMFTVLIERLKGYFKKGYIELSGINQRNENAKPLNIDEDKPANDEFSMRIVINSEGTTVSLSADFSKLKYPQSFVGALEEIKYKIIQQHGFIK